MCGAGGLSVGEWINWRNVQQSQGQSMALWTDSEPHIFGWCDLPRMSLKWSLMGPMLKGWNKESIGLGKGKEWLATLSSLLTLSMNTSTIILGILDSAFLLVPKVSRYGSSVIWYKSYLYLWHSTNIYWTYHVLSKNKTKPSEPYWNTIIRIIVIIIATSWVYLLAPWEERQAEVQAAVLNQAGQHGRGDRGVSAEMWGLVTCGSGLKSSAQELGYFFPGKRGVTRSFVMRKWQDLAAFKRSTEGRDRRRREQGWWEGKRRESCFRSRTKVPDWMWDNGM